jgi:hypothetical protein
VRAAGKLDANGMSWCFETSSVNVNVFMQCRSIAF